jgi:hypothetical protein
MIRFGPSRAFAKICYADRQSRIGFALRSRPAGRAAIHGRGGLLMGG